MYLPSSQMTLINQVWLGVAWFHDDNWVTCACLCLCVYMCFNELDQQHSSEQTESHSIKQHLVLAT